MTWNHGPYAGCVVEAGRLTIPRTAWKRPGFRPGELFAHAGLDFVAGDWTAETHGDAYVYTPRTTGRAAA